jgi:peptidoglycan/xylan/chitin deacetylase (PgdA/CDA1 family)
MIRKLYPQGKKKAFNVTYDDGVLQDVPFVELLNQYQIKGTFNLNSGRIEGHNSKVQVDEFEELYRGHEIASHTLTHPHLRNLDLGGVSYQVIRDRECLEEVLHRPVEGFAYPYGMRGETDEMVNCLRSCGIRYARTADDTHQFHLPQDYLRWNPTCHHSDPALFDLAEEFFKPDDLEHPWRITPKLFYLWGHSYEFANKWELLEQICQTLGSKEEVWYATNGEIIDYISAFNALRRSANAKYVYNPTDKDVYVFVHRKNILLKKGSITTLE